VGETAQLANLRHTAKHVTFITIMLSVNKLMNIAQPIPNNSESMEECMLLLYKNKVIEGSTEKVNRTNC
jgi:hypothetical protein